MKSLLLAASILLTTSLLPQPAECFACIGNPCNSSSECGGINCVCAGNTVGHCIDGRGLPGIKTR